MPLIEELKDVRATGAISPTAWQFGRFVCRHAGANDDGQLFLAAILASQAVEASHVCADIAHLHADLNGHYPRYDDSRIRAAIVADTRLPTAVLPATSDTWLAHLRTDPHCQRVICTPATYATAPKPLVIDAQGRVYLHRYFDFEIQLAAVLRTMAATQPTIAAESTAASKTALDTLFPSVDRPGWDVNWPKVAGFAALNRCLTVITGGPGTGKTTVVARLLALVQQLCAKDLRISLAAPTGKAAARLAEALEEQRQELESAGIQPGAVDVKASTIHRLLGYRPNSIHFRHNAANPIEADLVIIDEASMVPLPMMRRIVDAVPEGARLILLGDMHQLASVESGYVLGDICKAASPAVFSADFRSRFEAVTTGPKDVIPAATDEPTVLSDSCIPLTYSWRFPPGSGIDRFSRAVNSGGIQNNPLTAAVALPDWDAPGILEPAGGTRETSAMWKIVPDTLREANRLPNRLLWRNGLLLKRYQTFLGATEPLAALTAFDEFRILCAIRQGPQGVYELNQLIEEVLSLDYCSDRAAETARLAEAGVTHTLPSKRGVFYDHRPILITENNYGLGLFNGDTGVLLQVHDGDPTSLRAFFPPAPGETEPRRFVPGLLPAHETAFAMTIHKSQGSQFPDVLVVLPNRDNAVVGRELIYTAVTRASSRVELWLDEQLFDTAIKKPTVRHSGLADALSSTLETES